MTAMNDETLSDNVTTLVSDLGATLQDGVISAEVFTHLWEIPQKKGSIMCSGITSTGQRVNLVFADFQPYFYIGISKYSPVMTLPGLGANLKQSLLRWIEDKSFGRYKTLKDDIKLAIELYSISNGYSLRRKTPMVKVSCANVSVYRYILKQVDRFISSYSFRKRSAEDGKMHACSVALYNVFLRQEDSMLAQTYDIATAGWNVISVPKECVGRSSYSDFIDITIPTARCALSGEDCDNGHDVFVRRAPNVAKIPPFTTCAFDIEAYSSKRSGSIPTTKTCEDTTFQISMSFKTFGEVAPFWNVLLNLKIYDEDEFPIDDTDIHEVISCSDEVEIIHEFGKQIGKYRPAFIYGHNINGFDYNHIITRYNNFYRLVLDDVFNFHLPRIFTNYPEKPNVEDWTCFKHARRMLGPIREIIDNYWQTNSPLKLSKSKRRLVKIVSGFNVSRLKRTFLSSDFVSLFKREDGVTDKLDVAELNSVGKKISLAEIASQFIISLIKVDIEKLLEKWPKLDFDNDIGGEFFVYDGRRGIRYTTKSKQTNTAAFGQMTQLFPVSPHLLSIDTLSVARTDEVVSEGKLEDYKLNTVAKFFLNEEKEDMSPERMFDIYREEATARNFREIGIYCMKDSTICHRLTDRLNTIAKNSALSSICYLNLSHIFYSGQTVRTSSIVKKISKDQLGILIKNVSYAQNKEKYKRKYNYPGAYVFPAKSGLVPYIACYDFKSLYPSLIISRNLSPDAIVGYEIFELKGSKELVKSCSVSPIKAREAKASGDNRTYVEGLRYQYYSDLIESAVERGEITYKLSEKKTFVNEAELERQGIGVNEFTIHLSYHNLNTGGAKKANKTKGNFEGFYNMVVRFVDDSEDKNQTGFLSVVSKYLLDARNDVKRGFKSLYGPIDEERRAIRSNIAILENRDGKDMSQLSAALDKKVISKLVSFASDTEMLLTPSEEERDIATSIRRLVEMYQKYDSIDSQQLGYKMVGNSIYGQTGSDFSLIYSIAVAGSITTLGKKCIKDVAELFKKDYTGGSIVYGDTDSVFVNFGQSENFIQKYNGKTIQVGKEKKDVAITFDDNPIPDQGRRLAIMAESEEFVKRVDAYFFDMFQRRSLILEFEKIICPFFQIKKKVYFGSFYDGAVNKTMERPNKRIKNGTLVKKRSYSKFIKNIYVELMELCESNPAGFKESVLRRLETFLHDFSFVRFNVLDTAKSAKLNDIESYDSSILKMQLLYFNRSVERNRYTRIDIGQRFKYVYVYRPLYFTGQGRLINASVHYYTATEEEFLRDFPTEKEQRAQFNLWLYFQSELSGGLGTQFLSLLPDINPPELYLQNGIHTFTVGKGRLVGEIKNELLSRCGRLKGGKMFKVVLRNEFESENEQSPLTRNEFMISTCRCSFEITDEDSASEDVRRYFLRPKPGKGKPKLNHVRWRWDADINQYVSIADRET